MMALHAWSLGLYSGSPLLGGPELSDFTNIFLQVRYRRRCAVKLLMKWVVSVRLSCIPMTAGSTKTDRV